MLLKIFMVETIGTPPVIVFSQKVVTNSRKRQHLLNAHLSASVSCYVVLVLVALFFFSFCCYDNLSYCCDDRVKHVL